MPTEKEIFELARKRFLESSKMTPEELEAAIEFNKSLHTHTAEELFRVIN